MQSENVSGRVMRTHREIIQNLNQKEDVEKSEENESETSPLSRKEWDAVDPVTRQRILMERKAQMLKEARRRYADQ